MDESLQFEKAELPIGQVGCSACKGTVHQHYFELNGQTLCAQCTDQIRAVLAGKGSRLGRFGRALLFGLGAAILSSAVYYGIVATTGYEFGIVAIFIGIFVGSAVRRGSGGRGGWRYQILAALLTYLAIVSTYIPSILKEIRSHPVLQEESLTKSGVASSNSAAASEETSAGETASAEDHKTTVPKIPKPLALIVAAVLLLVVAMAAPILAGFQNILGLVIIGFGVWRAWAVNRRVDVQITGPHMISSGAAPPLMPVANA